jgi:hypothetical protein
MAKLMSKSELIQKISEHHPNNITRTDVRGVIESLCARIRQIRCRQEPRHKGAERHQSVHKGADNIQGEAGSEDHQGSAGKGRQGRGIVASRWSMRCGGPRSKQRSDPRARS